MISNNSTRPMEEPPAAQPSPDPSRPGGPNVPSARSKDAMRTLLRAHDTDLAPAAISRQCLRPLTKAVWGTAGWGPNDYGITWKIGDFKFLILESTVGPDAILYAQLWSEPEEQVVFEVSSGESNPGAKPFIDAAARERLSAMGFAIGGEARNFRKLVTIGSPADAELVAAEMLAVFTDALKYAGRTPLTVRLVRDERSSRAAVHESLTPEDLTKLLSHSGFEASLVPGITPPTARVPCKEAVMGIVCDGRVGDSNLYSVFDFFFAIDDPNQPQVEELAAIHREFRFITGFVDRDGDLTFRASLSLDGGITEQAIVSFVQSLNGAMRQVLRRMSKLGRPARRTREDVTVH